MILETNSAEQTYQVGFRMGERANPGNVVALIGDLGVGKTVFTKGFAKGLGIEDVVNSPTFTILQEYPEGRIPLYHFDAYRIENEDEMAEIGFEDYIAGDGVCLIEWADQIYGILPERRIEIRIDKDPAQGFDYRKLTIEKLGA